MRTLNTKAFVAACGVLLAATLNASAAIPNLKGVYHDPNPGTLEFTAVENQGGYWIGYYMIDGVEYLGRLRPIPNSGGKVELVWLYDMYPNYPTAGECLVTFNPSKGNYVGSIVFYDPRGNVTSQGRADLR